MSTTTLINPTTDRDAWLAERRKGVGASEAAAVLGRSPYEDATTLALRKLGRLPEVEENESMELGSLLEPVLAELYQRRTGRRLTEQQVFRRDQVRPFIFATADAIDAEGELVEFKTTGVHSDSSKSLGEDGTDELPEHWLIQAQQQMHVFNGTVCHFAVLVGGQRFRTFEVARNQRIIDVLVGEVERFWAKVQAGEVPESSRTVYTPRVLAALNPECSGEIEAGEELTATVAEYDRLYALASSASKTAEDLKVQILKQLGTNEIAALPDGRRVKRYLKSMPERNHTIRAHTQHFFKILKGAK